MFSPLIKEFFSPPYESRVQYSKQFSTSFPPSLAKPAGSASPIQVILEEPRSKRPQPTAALSGRELAAMMKVGAKVMRGADWKWGDQDGGALGVGRVIGELGEDGWVRVQWETGSTNSYR